MRDEENERPIPSSWRATIQEIVHSFVRKDYQLGIAIQNVAPVSPQTATQIADYVLDYRATLIPLPDESWNSSVCMWTGTRWDAVVDLWTHEEGRSDLVLSLRVTEVEAGFTFQIYMVYVP